MRDNDNTTVDRGVGNGQSPSIDAPTTLSKNQQKKLRRREAWEAGREERKVKRKQKAKEKKLRLRAAKSEDRIKNVDPSDGAAVEANALGAGLSNLQMSTRIPMTFVIDCGFDELMIEKEIVSLSSQVTRCYSKVKQARYRPRVAVTSFNGRLKERFHKVLNKDYKSWRDIHFTEKRFDEVNVLASEWMKPIDRSKSPEHMKALEGSTDSDGQIIYLSGDSPTTLERLEPNSIYIIGGLVDRNRHKGVCYKRAAAAGIKTARLPIEEYLDMSTRTILATNHVFEIMLRWLEVGHWGQAFLSVIPQRKGRKLKVWPDEVDDDEKDQELGRSVAPVATPHNGVPEQDESDISED